jgi:hypothetical protein
VEPSAVLKPRKFCDVLLFLASSDHGPDTLHNAYVRLICDRSLLQIGCSFEICDADAPDRFGQVTRCKADSRSQFLVVEVSVAPSVVYLPCAAAHCDGLITEVYHVFVGKLGEAKLRLELEHRHASICEFEKMRLAANKCAFQDVNKQNQDLKREALHRSNLPIQLTSDEFGMVRLRQGFLISQPFISDVVKWLMSLKEWYGSCCDDACIRFFRSSSGPWDIFTLFNFLLRRKAPNKDDSKDIFGATADALGPFPCNEAEKDAFRARLEGIFLDIFCARNWWAHLGATSSDCLRALQAIKDFVKIVNLSSKFHSGNMSGSGDSSICRQSTEAVVLLHKLDCAMIGISAPRSISMDDVSYLFFLRACQKLCTLCTDVSATLHVLEFSELLKSQLRQKGLKGSRRQSECIEVADVTAALCNLKQVISDRDFTFDCDFIRGTRNSLSHASNEGNRVILVLLALGAIARVLEFIVDNCLSQSCLPVGSSIADSERAELLQLRGRSFRHDVTLCQTELLARAGICDVDKLIRALFLSQKPSIDKCPFNCLIYNVKETKMYFRAVQFLLDQKMSGLCDVDERLASLILQPEKTDPLKALLRSLLYLIARIPPGRSQNLDDALAWLLEPQVPGLLQSCGLNLLVEDFKERGGSYSGGFFISRAIAMKDSSEYGFAAKQFLEFCCSYTKMQKSASKFRKALHEYDMACFSSQKYRSVDREFRETNLSKQSTGSSILAEWTDRLLFLVAYHRDAKLQPLIHIAKNVKTLLESHFNEKTSFDAFSDSCLHDVIFFLKTLASTYLPFFLLNFTFFIVVSHGQRLK